MSSKLLVTLTDDLAETLEEYSRTTAVPKAAVCRKALAEYLKKKGYDVGKTRITPGRPKDKDDE